MMPPAISNESAAEEPAGDDAPAAAGALAPEACRLRRSVSGVT